MRGTNEEPHLTRLTLASLVSILVVISALHVAVIPGTATNHTDFSPTETTIEGAAFPVPESMEDEVEEYRDRLPQDLAPNAFVVATPDNLYVVFSDSKSAKGRATVTGQSLDRGISAKGLEFNVMRASETSVETVGDETTISDVKNNPESYELELVRIDAPHRQISLLNDPDQGENITVPVSAGLLTEDPVTANDLLSQPAAKARSLGINTSTDALGTSTDEELTSILGEQQPQLFTFDFEKRYWRDTEETVDGIVLTPGSRALEFATTFDETGVLKSRNSDPMLYLVESQHDSQSYSDVSSLQQFAEDGDVVTIEANLYGQTTSTQETLEENTACGQSQAQVPSPSGSACVDALQDVLVDGGAAWTSVPESKDDLLFVAGLYAEHLDEPSIELKGEYRITGEVVSTSRFDESLPEGKVLIIYELERTGELQFSELSGNAQSAVTERITTLESTIQSQINFKEDSSARSNSEGTPVDTSSSSNSGTANTDTANSETSNSDTSNSGTSEDSDASAEESETISEDSGNSSTFAEIKPQSAYDYGINTVIRIQNSLPDSISNHLLSIGAFMLILFSVIKFRPILTVPLFGLIAVFKTSNTSTTDSTKYDTADNHNEVENTATVQMEPYKVALSCSECGNNFTYTPESNDTVHPRGNNVFVKRGDDATKIPCTNCNAYSIAIRAIGHSD